MMPIALLAASLAAAQVRPAPGGFIPPLAGGAELKAPAQDAVLGVFEGESDTLFWFERDARAGLSSKSVQDYVTANPKAGSRKVGDLLRAAGGGWLVLREPASGQEHYAFLDGGVFYLPIPATMKVGSAELPRTSLSAQGGALSASYGSPEAGQVAIKSFRPSQKGSESTVGVFAYENGGLVEAVVADRNALAALLKDKSLAGTAKSLAAEAEGGSALSRIEAFLEDGAARVVTLKVNKSGQALFKLREGDADAAYVHASPSGARYLQAAK